jgi:type I restriction enzyme S subunit
MGQSPSSIYYNESGLGLPLVQGNADIKNRKSIVRNYSSVSPKTCSVEDILISVRAPVGEIAIASYESCLGRGVAALKAIQCPDFIYQLMIYNEGEWAKFSKGSTFDSITSEQVRDFKLSLPPLPEQVAIATLLSDLDAELSALRARREKLGLVKGGMMEVLLSGGVRLV